MKIMNANYSFVHTNAYYGKDHQPQKLNTVKMFSMKYSRSMVLLISDYLL